MSNLSDAYEAGPPEQAVIQRRLRAANWRRSPEMERAEELISAGKLEPNAELQLALAYYQADRRAAAAEGIDTTGGEAA